jgi:hypothetical protein
MTIRAFAMGEAKSIIDRAKGIIVLRTSGFPKKGSREWVISGDTVVVNKVGSISKGIASEVIQISSISRLDLDIGKISGNLDIWGNIPKLWTRGMGFNVPDMFVAYEAYLYILSKRIDDTQNPIKHKVSPVVVGLREKLDNGELNKEQLRARGMHF